MKDFKKSSTSSKDTRKIRKILNEEVRLGISANSDSETEEADLHKELFPLSNYINNREEMIEQMFSIIKGPKLKKMLPPILKDLPLDELKADCLIHLLGMSSKRIVAILEGREINSSSDSETHSDSSTNLNKKTKLSLKPIVIKQEGCSDISDNSEEVVLVDPDIELLNVKANHRKIRDVSEGDEKIKRHHSNKHKKRKLEEKEQKANKKFAQQENLKIPDEIELSDVSHDSSSENGNNDQAPKEGQTLLEILELEMRARAIRALLQKGGNPESREHETAIEQGTSNKEDKSSKALKEIKSGTEKVTPKKNLRKKTRKSDDVIVIAPKLVTIDLTDEHDPDNAIKITTETKENNSENLLCIIQNNTKEKCEESIKSPKISFSESNSNSSETKIKNVRCEGSEASEDVNILNPPEKRSDNLEIAQIVDEPRGNWAQRWLESKEVKKVVSTSKICGNIRKRIKSAKLAKKCQESSPTIKEPQEIEGSVGEYKLLLKSRQTSDTNEGNPDSNNLESNITLTSVEGVGEQATSYVHSKATASSVEQVQDVTSTKCEAQSESKLQESCGTEIINNQNEDQDLKSECVEFKTDIGELKLASSDLNSKNCVTLDKNSSELKESQIVENSNTGFKQKKLKYDSSNLDNSVSVRTELSSNVNLLLASSELTDPSSQSETCELEPSSDVSSQTMNCESRLLDDTKSVSKEIPSDKNTNQLVNIRHTQCTDKTSELIEYDEEKFSEETSNTRLVGEKIMEKCNPTQEINEPETLEINITEEDLQIDGMIDEKLEAEYENIEPKNNEVIEIDLL